MSGKDPQPELHPLSALRVCIVAEHASLGVGRQASLPLHHFWRLRARRIVAGLAKAQKMLSMDPVIAARLGQAGRKRIKQHFDWNAKIDRIIGC